MSNIEQLHPLVEKLVETTLTSLARRPLPISGHQAAAELYHHVDEYADAVIKNQSGKAKTAIEHLATDVVRLLCAYQRKTQPVQIDQVHIEGAAKASEKAPR
jgi:hypothetical protein